MHYPTNTYGRTFCNKIVSLAFFIIFPKSLFRQRDFFLNPDRFHNHLTEPPHLLDDNIRTAVVPYDVNIARTNLKALLEGVVWIVEFLDDAPVAFFAKLHLCRFRNKTFSTARFFWWRPSWKNFLWQAPSWEQNFWRPYWKKNFWRPSWKGGGYSSYARNRQTYTTCS